MSRRRGAVPVAPPRTVRCACCLATVPWPADDQRYRFVDNTLVPVDLGDLTDPAQRRDTERALHRRCPNRRRPEHYLPALYYEYGPPLAIGLVGGSKAGKTHLLTSAVGALLSERAPLPVAVLDHRRHARFRARNVDALFGTADEPQSRELDGSSTGLWEPEEILLVTPPGGAPRPVSLFDVAGGDLADTDTIAVGTDSDAPLTGRAGSLLFAVDALLFVQPVGDPPDHGPQLPTIAQALDRLAARDDHRWLPAAVALTKCDRLRFDPVVDRWLRAPVSAVPDAATTRAESADAYAVLERLGHRAALRPAAQFERLSMHFVSATGREARQRRYARGVEPMRVLQPFAALFAMSGLLPEGAEVGR